MYLSRLILAASAAALLAAPRVASADPVYDTVILRSAPTQPGDATPKSYVDGAVAAAIAAANVGTIPAARLPATVPLLDPATGKLSPGVIPGGAGGTPYTLPAATATMPGGIILGPDLVPCPGDATKTCVNNVPPVALAGSTQPGDKCLIVRGAVTGLVDCQAGGAAPAAETLAVATPGAQVAGQAFALPGTYANGPPSALDWSLDGAAWTQAAATIGGGSYSIPGVVVPAATPSQTVRVRDRAAQAVVATSGPFAVSAAAAGGGYPLTFAGAAGPLTGSQVVSAWIQGGDISGFSRDGSGNVALSATPNSTGLFVAAGQVPANGTVSATIVPGTNRAMTIAVRASGAGATSRGYMLSAGVGGGKIYAEFVRYDNGVGTSIATEVSGNVSDPGDAVWSVVEAGSTHTFKIGNTTILTATDSAYAGPGFLGIGSQTTTGGLTRVSQVVFQ